MLTQLSDMWVDPEPNMKHLGTTLKLLAGAVEDSTVTLTDNGLAEPVPLKFLNHLSARGLTGRLCTSPPWNTLRGWRLIAHLKRSKTPKHAPGALHDVRGSVQKVFLN